MQRFTVGIFNRRSLRRRPALFVALLIWAAAVGFGMSALTRYASIPGPSARSSDTWPVLDGISLAPDRPTLVMFLHPYCACSRATLEELNHALAQCRDEVETRIVFFKPLDQSSEWVNTDLWRSAQNIPGVSVVRDDEARICRTFGALTSGQVLLYSPRGNLLFSGGITGSRGHVGDNNGLDRLISSIHAQGAAHGAAAEAHASTPVYGCGLDGAASASAQELQEQLQ